MQTNSNTPKTKSLQRYRRPRPTKKAQTMETKKDIAINARQRFDNRRELVVPKAVQKYQTPSFTTTGRSRHAELSS